MEPIEPPPGPPPASRVRTLILLPVVLVAALVLLLGAGAALGLLGDRATLPSDAPTAAPTGTSVAASPTAAPTLTPAPTPTPTPTLAATVTLVGAGDIATCGGDNDEATAKLLDGIEGTVFTTGDNAYDSGTPEEFAECYHPTWGRHLDRTRPAPGNHDHRTEGLAGYHGYFGERAGGPDKSWYSYELGAWHVIVLDSDCKDAGGCDLDSPQGQWLIEDLAASRAQCTVAMWHHPRFSSGFHGNDRDVDPFWRALYAADADVVLNGHDHDYERFAPQDPDANPDSRGIRQFVVGTGGAALRDFEAPVANSIVRASISHGVLRLTLHQSAYDWQFISVDGMFSDSGSGFCH